MGKNPGVSPRRDPLKLHSHLMVLIGLSALFLIGCRGANERTDYLAPIWWRSNPWGPKANQARRVGELPPIDYDRDMIAWEEFARDHLQTGDILFREASARVAFGLVPFSKIAGHLADTPYTHTGIFVWESGEPIVYDTSIMGPRRQPLGIWSLDNVGPIGIKRVRSPYRNAIPSAVDFCQEVYRSQIPFDLDLGLGDDQFYCLELTARSFENAGLSLSRPIKIRSLPRFDDYANLFLIAELVSPLDRDQEMFVSGNDRFGMWASPALETIYVAPDGHRPHPSRLTRLPTPQEPPDESP